MSFVTLCSLFVSKIIIVCCSLSADQLIGCVSYM